MCGPFEYGIRESLLQEQLRSWSHYIQSLYVSEVDLLSLYIGH